MRKFINKILDLPKLILRLWICLWICLLILLILKFCFGIWYPIVIENQSLLDFSNYVDNTWLKYLFLSITYLINSNLIYLICTRKRGYTKLYEVLGINLLTICIFITKIYVYYLGFGLEFIISILIPIIYLIKTNPEVNKLVLLLYVVIVQSIIMIWQLNILFVRNYPINLDEVGTIFQIVLQLDYYIFLSVLWIGVSYMGLAGFWFFINDVTKLKAIKEKELSRNNPNMATVKAIDEKIAKLEAR